MNYNFKVRDQNLHCLNIDRHIIGDSTEFHTASFEFDSAWDSLEKKVIFINKKSNVSKYWILNGSTSCYIPKEVLSTAGELIVCVNGVHGATEVNTYMKNAMQIVLSNKVDADPAEEPTPSEYAQLRELINAIVVSGNGTAYVEMGVYNGYVCYRTTSSGDWIQIVSLDSLTGGPGDPGAAGNGIASIEKSDTNGLIDTYTITFTNGDTDTFTVTNAYTPKKGTDYFDGINGKSAYEIAVQNGFVGTIAEWLTSIRGYTPQKLVDYFTTADVTQIKNDIIAALTTGVTDTTSTGAVSKQLVANTPIKITTALTSLTLTLPASYNWYDVFTIIFSTSALTLPSGVIWHDGTAPTITSGKWYELSIRDGRAVLSGGAAS